MEEKWVDILGFTRYQVSNIGRIKRKELSFIDSIGRVYCHKERIIRQGNDKDGYQLVGLINNHKLHTRKVHRLVAQAFIDNPDNRPMINHKDTNIKNNHCGNLEWATAKENGRHAVINGLYDFFRGNKHPLSHLSDDDVINIRSLEGQMSQLEISKIYNVHQTTISEILRHNTWTHL